MEKPKNPKLPFLISLDKKYNDINIDTTTTTSSYKKAKDNSSNWQNLLNMAETKVQVVSNLDGYKVYKTVH